MDGSTIIFLPIILFCGLLIFDFLMLVLKLFKNVKSDSYTGKVGKRQALAGESGLVTCNL